MKKVLLSAAAALVISAGAMAQGSFSTLTAGYYKVHVYEPDEASQPRALIVEGDKGLVVVDRPTHLHHLKNSWRASTCL